MKDQPFHHGNLKAALIDAGIGALEQGADAELSLRELARRIGVSPTAAYRHFASKDDLLLAIAAQGFAALEQRFAEGPARRYPRRKLADIGIAYVVFALERPAMFGLMFSTPMLRALPGGGLLSDGAFGVLRATMAEADPAMDATACDLAALRLWSLFHGAAVLAQAGRLPLAPDFTAEQRAAWLLQMFEPVTRGL